jgi:hypothetical protein
MPHKTTDNVIPTSQCTLRKSNINARRGIVSIINERLRVTNKRNDGDNDDRNH